jgi:hypothetical protein
MPHYSVARGKKKRVENFKPKHGLYIVAMVMLFGMFLLLLTVFGVLHIDGD